MTVYAIQVGPGLFSRERPGCYGPFQKARLFTNAGQVKTHLATTPGRYPPGSMVVRCSVTVEGPADFGLFEYHE